MAGKQADHGNQPDSPIHAADVCGAGPRPYDNGRTYSQCYEPLHDGAPAPITEALMRSRYTTLVVGDKNCLFRT